MDGAAYALLLNGLVALLFAVAFAIIRLSYPSQRHVLWFSAVYLLGMLSPLSELGVRMTDHPAFFVAASYIALLMSVVAMPLGLSAIAGRPLPWRTAGAILAGGILARIAIWDGPRNNLAYELTYQAPFAIGTAFAMAIAIGVARRRGDRLWHTVAIVLGLMTAYFVVKPFFASSLGSGATATSYISSRYALFSQATGGVLIVSAGLLVLLIVVRSAIGQTILESESDALTSLLNRRGFERQSSRLFAEAQRTGSPLAVIIFDLDDFKRVNDSHGHATGDAVIQAFADLLRTTAPPAAVIARWGGEEFVLLLDRTSLEGAWYVAQSIRSALATVASHLPQVTVSGGVAELQADDTVDALLQRADNWAYVAKRDGRNRICPVPATPSHVRLIASNP